MSEGRCHLPTALVIVLQGLAHIAMHCIGRGNHPEMENFKIYYGVFKKQNLATEFW